MSVGCDNPLTIKGMNEFLIFLKEDLMLRFTEQRIFSNGCKMVWFPSNEVSLTLRADWQPIRNQFFRKGGMRHWFFIWIYRYMQVTLKWRTAIFLLLPNQISLLSLIPSFSLLNVLTDFLTIIKYRKNNINNILWS